MACLWITLGATQAAFHAPHDFIFTSANHTDAPASGAAQPELVSNDLWEQRVRLLRERERDDKVLLPAHVVPLKYHVTIRPDLDTFTFNGTETVEVLIVEPSDSVTLHAYQLTITQAAMRWEDGSVMPAMVISYSEESKTATIQFPHTLQAGSAQLVLDFEGLINDQLNGFYRSSYTHEGVLRHLGVTQFQPTDARRAFPCWDEPALKAKFEVTLIVAEELTALSNTPIKATSTLGDGLKMVEFSETPLMSTYLVAFVVGHLEFVEGATAEGVAVRVYTPLGKKEGGQFALDVATRTLSYFEDYFGIAYPLPKLDLVAAPDFAAGAMENWGCAIFREALLLVDETTSSLSIKQFVAYVVAHELAHQWFGNLVSPGWWDYLWLNEGFATWVGNLAVDHLFPEWDIWTKFISDYTTTGLSLDSLASSHPVEVHVKEASEIREIFDHISYDKGASIVRMLASYLGEETFSRGLHRYLNRHIYNNTVTEDLWAALTELAGKPIVTLMDPWVKATGYPVLYVDHERVSDEEAFLTVKQERFFSLSPGGSEAALQLDPIWWIPLSLLTSENASQPLHHSLWEGGRGKKVERVPLPSELATLGDGRWVKVNALQTGFFRVKYSEPLLRALQPPLLSLTLRPSDRLGLLDDAFALCKAGHMSTPQLLALLQSYVNENSFPVWASLTTNLEDLRSSWRQSLSAAQASEEYTLMQTYIQKLYRPIIKALGWTPKEGEDRQQMLLRSVVLSYGGSHGLLKDVIAEATRQFHAHREDEQGAPIHPDLLTLVYNLAVKFGGEKEWEAMREIYRNPKSQEQKIRATNALGKASDPVLIRRTLDLALSDEMRAQDVYQVFASVGANDAGIEIVWSFLKDKWSELDAKFGDQFLMLGRIVETATAYFATEQRVNDLTEFFADKQTAGIERKVQQCIERASSRSAWMQRDAQATLAWLRAHA